MADSIRIKNGVKKIEVNDEGDYISLPLGDDGFVRDFYKILEDTQNKVQKIQDGELQAGDILGGMDQVITVGSFLKQQVDGLFGDGTCKKVFGDINPGVDLFMEFFNAIVPFIEDYKKERESRLNKYGADRTGSV